MKIKMKQNVILALEIALIAILQLLIVQNANLFHSFTILLADHALMVIMVDKVIGPVNYVMKIAPFVMVLILQIVLLAKNLLNILNTQL